MGAGECPKGMRARGGGAFGCGAWKKAAEFAGPRKTGRGGRVKLELLAMLRNICGEQNCGGYGAALCGRLSGCKDDEDMAGERPEW